MTQKQSHCRRHQFLGWLGVALMALTAGWPGPVGADHGPAPSGDHQWYPGVHREVLDWPGGKHFDMWRCDRNIGCLEWPDLRVQGHVWVLWCTIPGGARSGLGHCLADLGGDADQCPAGEYGDCFGVHAKTGGWTHLVGPANRVGEGLYDYNNCVNDPPPLAPERVAAVRGHFDCWIHWTALGAPPGHVNRPADHKCSPWADEPSGGCVILRRTWCDRDGVGPQSERVTFFDADHCGLWVNETAPPEQQPCYQHDHPDADSDTGVLWHAHCRPAECEWPNGAAYQVHAEGDRDLHLWHYFVCDPATPPDVRCGADGFQGHGDAATVDWADTATDTWTLTYQYVPNHPDLDNTTGVTITGPTAQISFDTPQLDAHFGTNPRAVQITVSAERHAPSEPVTITCGLSCAAALAVHADHVHVMAGSVAGAAKDSVGLTQVIDATRASTMYLIDTRTGDRIPERPRIIECAGHHVTRWQWAFTPQPHFNQWVRFVENKDSCLTGGGWCSYQIVDSDAVDQTLTISARTIATTKLNNRTVAGPWNTTNILVNTSYTP